MEKRVNEQSKTLALLLLWHYDIFNQKTTEKLEKIRRKENDEL